MPRQESRNDANILPFKYYISIVGKNIRYTLWQPEQHISELSREQTDQIAIDKAQNVSNRNREYIKLYRNEDKVSERGWFYRDIYSPKPKLIAEITPNKEQS